MNLAADLVPHMRRVQAADRDLHDLSLLWQMIEASSAISCPEDAEAILPTLGETRHRFEELQKRLVQQLATENLAELGDELESIAQCAIDILVRNLFERTADVGFLATDDELCGFCAAPPARRDELRPAFVKRLAEYRAKYTVYDDIVVLGTDGQVLARLDVAGPQVSHDAIVARAAERRGYVERYGPTDLAADGRPALLYGHRVDDASGRCIGVLVLRFRIVDELQRIFASIAADRAHVAVVLIDADDRVIVSSDESHVPLGATMQTTPPGEVAVSIFSGREYLSVVCATHGYQGYLGPGWRAQALVSLLTAFRGSHDDAASAGSDPVALDNDELHGIQAEVDAINRNLRRVVWNGRLIASSGQGDQARLKAVLQQVTQAGTRTRDRVAAAIGDLYRTSLGRAGHQTRELARLAADIMDRNLYERANDCRWWALSPVLRRVLAAPADAAGAAALEKVLATINGLYTVYTRLVAFDLDGRVRGVSNDLPDAPLAGTQVDPALVSAVQALPDSQRYAVTPFGPTPLNGGVPTYVYLAAVRAPGDGPVVGGIAIVFNAEREFRAMLDDVLAERSGLAAFVDAQGRIVACTDDRLPVGEALPFDPRLPIVSHEGANFAVASVDAAGYREFKVDDGYRNGVRAVVALRLGSLERRRSQLADQVLRAFPPSDRRAVDDLAIFHVGAERYAVPAASLLEARTQRGLVRTPGSTPAVVGMLEVASAGGSCMVPVVCARRLLGLTREPRATDGVVLVIATPGTRRAAFGLRVDDVLTVAEVGHEHRQPVPGGLRQGPMLVEALLRLRSEAQGQVREAMVQQMDLGELARHAGLSLQAGHALPA